MNIFLIILFLAMLALFYGRNGEKRRLWLKNNSSTKKQFKLYLLVSLLTMFFFSTSFGILFYKAIVHPNPPKTDNGLGMAVLVFLPPFLLTLLTTTLSAMTIIFVKSEEKINGLIGLFAGLLIIPVGLFGVICALATILGIIKLIG